ncbi:hypothetical protein K8T06_16935 [bacterium]|nr:hypothetical protein [bacterium]
MSFDELVNEIIHKLQKLTTHIALCTDGHPGQVLGITGLLKELGPILESLDEDCHVWIVAPPVQHSFIRFHLSNVVPRSRLRLLDAEMNEKDRYHVQIGLSEVFRRVDAADYVFCLDYDHLIVKLHNTPFFKRPKCVVVSSEVRSDSFPQLNCLYGKQTNLKTLNISLIWGRADHLKEIGDLWIDAYNELEPILQTRFLVEYAFGLAAYRSRVKVARCDRKLQGNLVNLNTSCDFFHYGGDHDVSLLLKTELYRLGKTLSIDSDISFVIAKFDKFLRSHILEQRNF